eukprot:scaffold285531_cov29-Prasinocladus_malaysianus.AAC.2
MAMSQLHTYLSMSWPFLASLYSGCPLILMAEYIGGTCIMSPRNLSRAARSSSSAHVTKSATYTDVHIPGRATSAHMLIMHQTVAAGHRPKSVLSKEAGDGAHKHQPVMCSQGRRSFTSDSAS